MKKGDAAPIVVTVKDSAGKPVPNIAFILKRGEAVPRNSGATLYGDVDAMDDLTVQLHPVRQSRWLTVEIPSTESRERTVRQALPFVRIIRQDIKRR